MGICSIREPIELKQYTYTISYHTNFYSNNRNVIKKIYKYLLSKQEEENIKIISCTNIAIELESIQHEEPSDSIAPNCTCPIFSSKISLFLSDDVKKGKYIVDFTRKGDIFRFFRIYVMIKNFILPKKADVIPVWDEGPP